MIKIYFILIIVLMIFQNVQLAQEKEVLLPKPPKFGLPRYLEDYSYLKNSPTDNFYSKVKFFPLSEWDYISFGGEARLRYEYFNNYLLDESIQDNNGYLLNRYLFHSDLHLGQSFRVFIQFQSSNVVDRTPGPRGIDKNWLDFNQVFLDYINDSSIKFKLRIGRQELFFGANRIFDYREGPNSRLSFTGVKLDILEPMSISLFYLMPNRIYPDYFDDKPETNKKVLGISYTSANIIYHSFTDFYFLYNEFPPEKNFLIAKEKRYSMGIRNLMTIDMLSMDFEAIFQLAQINGENKSAYSIGWDLNYKIIPQNDFLNLGYYFLVLSGSTSQKNTTFQSLYATNFNFRTIDLFGRYNLTYIQPYIQIKPLINDRLILESIFYWRSSKSDNVYSAPGFKLIDSNQFEGNFLGYQLNLMYAYYWNDFFQTEIGYRTFLTSNSLKSVGKALRLDYISASVTFRF